MNTIEAIKFIKDKIIPQVDPRLEEDEFRKQNIKLVEDKYGLGFISAEVMFDLAYAGKAIYPGHIDLDITVDGDEIKASMPEYERRNNYGITYTFDGRVFHIDTILRDLDNIQYGIQDLEAVEDIVKRFIS